MLISIHTFSFKQIHVKMSSAKWQPFYLGLNVLTHCGLLMHIYAPHIRVVIYFLTLWVIIVLCNGSSSGWCQAITCTNEGVSIHWTLGIKYWPLGDVAVILNYWFQTHIKDRYLEHFLWNCPQLNAASPHSWLVNIGLGNSLVPWDTKFCKTVWHH